MAKEYQMSRVVADRTTKNESLCQTVVSAVADRINSEPTALEPLYYSIDPDALDSVFQGNEPGSDRAPSRVEFSYCGCEVVISGDGTVRVSKPEQEIEERSR